MSPVSPAFPPCCIAILLSCVDDIGQMNTSVRRLRLDFCFEDLFVFDARSLCTYVGRLVCFSCVHVLASLADTIGLYLAVEDQTSALTPSLVVVALAVGAVHVPSSPLMVRVTDL